MNDGQEASLPPKTDRRISQLLSVLGPCAAAHNQRIPSLASFTVFPISLAAKQDDFIRMKPIHNDLQVGFKLVSNLMNWITASHINPKTWYLVLDGIAHVKCSPTSLRLISREINCARSYASFFRRNLRQQLHPAASVSPVP